MPNPVNIANNWCFWLSLAIVDTRSCDAPQQEEVITGQTACCLLHHLDCLVERSDSENIIFHTLEALLFSKFNGTSPTNRIVRFVMRTKLKASYRMVQYEYVYRYTPSLWCFWVILKLDIPSPHSFRIINLEILKQIIFCDPWGNVRNEENVICILINLKMSK